MASPINEIPEEEVVEALDVTSFVPIMGCAPQIEETHKVAVLTMDVPEDLDRRLQLEDHVLLLDDRLRVLAQRVDLLWLEAEVSVLLELGVLLGPEQLV